MAAQQPARRSASPFNHIDDWMAQRRADVLRLGHEAEAAGRQAWARATRAGQDIAARTPAAVRELGARALDTERQLEKQAQDAGRSIRKQVHAAAEPARRIARKAGDQVLAGARGAEDAFTLGLGDKAYAGAGAIYDAAHGADLADAYKRRNAIEEARNKYDAEHYKAARVTGEVLGTGLQLALGGGLELGVAKATRIPQVTRLAVRELAALGGVGAGAGVGGQAVSDAVTGRLSSPRDYFASGVGGAAGALASRTGSGAFAGAVASGATAALEGKSPMEVLEATGAGGLLGGAAGRLGRQASDNLSNKSKEKLGEGFSQLRTMLRGDLTKTTKKTAERLSGGRYTLPDQRTFGGELVESKFGRQAQLSPRQRQAYNELSNYRVDHTIPADVGTMMAFPAAGVGYHYSLLNPIDPEE